MKNLILLLSLMICANSFGKVGFSPVKGYTSSEMKVLEVAVKLSNELLASQCFSEFVLKRKKLIETSGKTRLQVIDHLANLDLKVPLRMYYKNNGVVGYRQPPSPQVNTNRKFHSGSTACSRGSNLTHEWSHSGGYGHSYKANYNRQFSVPYTINAGFLACCKCTSITNCRIEKKPVKIKPKICRRNWKWLWLKKSCIQPK